MNVMDIHIGLLKYSNTLSSEFYTGTSCWVIIEAGQQYTIGLQILTISDETASRNDAQITITKANNTDVLSVERGYLDKEIISEQNQIQIMFNAKQTSDQTEDSGDEVTVVFYSFAYKNDDGLCNDDSAQGCELTERCVHQSMSDHLEQYNICQNENNVQVIERNSSSPEFSFLGVAVFAVTLALLFLVLMAMHKTFVANIAD